MDIQKLQQSLNILATNYNKAIDDNLMTLWCALFIDFNEAAFKDACLEVMATSKFFPNAKEIIDAYKHVKQLAKDKRIERLKKDSRLLADKQSHCHLCDNVGTCLYKRGGYEFAARCICAHGRDLNKFSNHQLGNGTSGKFYIKTIRETLSDDDFVVFDAQKKERFLSRVSVANADKSEILNKLNDLQNHWKMSAASSYADQVAESVPYANNPFEEKKDNEGQNYA